MPNYRAYIMGPDDSIQNFVVLECPDDDAAVAVASVLAAKDDVELWQRSRKIKRLAPSQLRRPKATTRG